MDRYSEVEVKFDAEGLYLGQAQEFLDHLPSEYQIEKYMNAVGTDYFYALGTGTLRFRKDTIWLERQYSPDGNPAVDLPSRVTSCFTVKQRKSSTHLLDRKEVDLWVGPQTVDDVAALVAMLGGRLSFSIKKTYHVWMLRKGDIHICFAVYDVSRADGTDLKRFLEVEIERDSNCGPEEGKAELNSWIIQLQADLFLGEPVNQSLQEMYTPKPVRLCYACNMRPVQGPDDHCHHPNCVPF